MKFISSIHCAAESARTGRVVIETDRNRSKRVKARVKAHSDKVIAGDRAAALDMPNFMFTYGADGVEFTAVVYERRRWYREPDDEGLSVMTRGADGKSECAFIDAKFADLPPSVRIVARDVRAALNYGETRADKARSARYAKSRAEHDAWMKSRHPGWYSADGTLNREAMNAELSRVDACNAEIDAMDAQIMQERQERIIAKSPMLAAMIARGHVTEGGELTDAGREALR